MSQPQEPLGYRVQLIQGDTVLEEEKHEDAVHAMEALGRIAKHAAAHIAKAEQEAEDAE